MHDDKIKKLERQRKRLNTERISVQIVVEDSVPAFKQMFVARIGTSVGTWPTGHQAPHRSAALGGLLASALRRRCRLSRPAR
jgi:hypothetical protein